MTKHTLLFLDFLKFCFSGMQKRLLVTVPSFTGGWFQPIMHRWGCLVFALLGELIAAIFRPLSVLLVGFCFSSGRFDLLVPIFLLWAGIYVFNFLGRLYQNVLKLTVVHSVYYAAYQWILKVDPLFHATRSSGTVIGKIERGSRAYEHFLDAVIFDLFQPIIGVITVVITLAHYGVLMSIVILAILVLVCLLSVVTTHYISVPLEKQFIKADDKLKAASTEQLIQIHLIRTTFASQYARDLLYDHELYAAQREGMASFAFSLSFTIIKLVYLLSIFVLTWFVAGAVASGQLDSTVGVALILTYMRGTYDIVRIDRPIRLSFQSLTRIKDLFSFMSSFGQQTFPVVSEVSSAFRLDIPLLYDEVSIHAQGVSFQYSEEYSIFQGIGFDLRVPSNQKNKLYGIIGPSGIGKSTFLSMLGGQIRPLQGHIFLNDVDIYQVDDLVRRRLIALQRQLPSGIRGSVRYNLLFGIPREARHQFEDVFLIDLLNKVGLWNVFALQKGLETSIGESGFSLSLGQLQRLYFANLYVRASFFKPPFILIDEPTSSLDEISELFITDMVTELAQHSVTLVIAHRLKTIEKAYGMIDFSLVMKDKELKVHGHDYLKHHSRYYRRLMSGAEQLEGDFVS